MEAWWVENRPAAPDLFTDELAAALEQLADHPRLGGAYAHPRVAGVRRVLLFRCRYHVYYTVNDTLGLVRVVAVWHARRGSGPPLR